MAESLDDDVAAVARIEAVPTILEVVCRTTGMGFAVIARVTEDRWIACGVRDEIQFGLQPGGELKVETTICNEIMISRQAVVIDHVATDLAFAQHATPALYGFQSYISMPILLPGNVFFGTLCAIDPRPARLNKPEVIGMFKLFADLIAFHIDAHRRLAASEATLLTERESAELREQFIAVLGHDLRNPLAGIDGGAHLLMRRGNLDANSQSIVSHIRKSVDRMVELIDNVLDFARGRLGNGLTLDRVANAPLLPTLEQVLVELRAAAPDRVIDADFVLGTGVACDPNRIGQLLSNLVGNAISHGDPSHPVRVRARIDADCFELSVVNAGKPIPLETLPHLFKPFFRASQAQSNHQGLGLGLYISSEIAKAHGGTLSATSSDEQTCFSLRIPLN